MNEYNNIDERANLHTKLISTVITLLFLGAVYGLASVSYPYMYQLIGDKMTIQERIDFEEERDLATKMNHMCGDIKFNLRQTLMRGDEVFCLGYNGEDIRVGIIEGATEAGNKRFYCAHGYYPGSAEGNEVAKAIKATLK